MIEPSMDLPVGRIKWMSAEDKAAIRSIAAALLREAGVADADNLAASAQASSMAERDGDMVTFDAVSGQHFDAGGLMNQLASEGKDRMGQEFSRRRGYSEHEIQQFEATCAAILAAESAGADPDDVCFAIGVATGHLAPPIR